MCFKGKSNSGSSGAWGKIRTKVEEAQSTKDKVYASFFGKGAPKAPARPASLSSGLPSGMAKGELGGGVGEAPGNPAPFVQLADGQAPTGPETDENGRRRRNTRSSFSFSGIGGGL